MRSQAERKETQETLLKLIEKVERELKNIPGVVGVGIGFKEVAGEVTDEVVFRVYVESKKSPQDVTPSHMIPKEMYGHKTDVLTAEHTETMEDNSSHRPLLGGIQIGNSTGVVGTLGCMATLNSDGSWVALSNQHVLMGGGKQLATDVKIGQPDISECCCCSCGEIGTVVKSQIGGLVDCAIAKLNPDIPHVNEIDGIGPIRGSASAVVGDTVRKVGRSTGLTSGIVLDINFPTTSNLLNFTNQIKIKPDGANTKFSTDGDSGSAIVNAENKIVGLLWGGFTGNGVASHISNVQNAMDITIPASSGISKTVTNNRFAGYVQKSSGGAGAFDDAIYSEVEHTFAYTVFEKHNSEVFHLVNHQREVMVAWQRNEGPAFVAAFARSSREPNFKVPSEINGISIQHLLLSMYVVLDDHGSEVLRGDLKLYGMDFINIVLESDSLTSLNDSLRDMNVLRTSNLV